jgi:hypothetical protein
MTANPSNPTTTTPDPTRARRRPSERPGGRRRCFTRHRHGEPQSVPEVVVGNKEGPQQPSADSEASEASVGYRNPNWLSADCKDCWKPALV